MSEKNKFNCCKHLDHDKKKNQCYLRNQNNLYLYWERGSVWTEGGNPKDVQFCNKRGRLNEKSACIEHYNMCSDYENEERFIDLNKIKKINSL